MTKQPNPSNFKTFSCEHRHYPATCTCDGNQCTHIACWLRARYKTDNARIGFLDIETSGLQGDFHYTLCWFIKEKDKEHYDYAVINRKDIENSLKHSKVEIDKRILEKLVEDIKKYDFLICHYGAIDGKGLDIRHLRTRCMKYNLDFPVNKQIFMLDTWRMARNKLNLSSNRLDNIAEFLGCPIQKTRIDRDHWLLAGHGHKKSLEYVVDHNKKDVQILEFVFKKLEPYASISKTSI